MKKNTLYSIMTLFAIVFSLSVFISCNDDEDKHEAINKKMLTTIELNVEGMTCTGCEATVTNAVMELPGINHTEVSHIEGMAVVEFDKTKTTKEEIAKAVEGVGYKVVE